MNGLCSDAVGCFTAGIGGGGSIWAGGDSQLVLTNVAFINNVAPGANGGAIFSLGGVNATASLFVNNSCAGEGGAVSAVSLAAAGTTFQSNTAGLLGGAIFTGAGNSTLAATLVSGNFAGDMGGGAFCRGPMRLSNTTFTYNTAYSSGAGAPAAPAAAPRCR